MNAASRTSPRCRRAAADFDTLTAAKRLRDAGLDNETIEEDCTVRIPILLAYLSVAAAYALCAWQYWGAPPPGISSFLKYQMMTVNENSFIEMFSTAAWLTATVLFIRAFVSARTKSMRARAGGGNVWSRRWLLFFSILCVVALGEELSWGTHWTGPDPFAGSVNSQFSIHNSEIGDLKLELYMNIIFYAGLLFLWLALPILKSHRPLDRWEIAVSMPVPSGTVRLFFLLNTIVYLVLDRLFFNVGEVYEASIPIVVTLAAMTMRATADEMRTRH